MGTLGKTWTRIPKLSRKPHPGSGKYYSWHRENGKYRRQWFTADRKQSERLHREWVVRKFHAPSTPEPLEPDQASSRSFAKLVSDFLNHESGRWIPASSPRMEGRSHSRAMYAIRKETLDILTWAKGKFGDRVLREPIEDLFYLEHYEEMMRHFGDHLGDKSVKLRGRKFWRLVGFASVPPRNCKMTFNQTICPKIGGRKPGPRWEKMPSVEMIQRLLELARPDVRLWIWMAIAFAFHQQDLSRLTPAVMDKDGYDFRRIKVGNQYPRYGQMRPLVWTMLQDHLSSNPKGPHDRIFTNTRGKPLIQERDSSTNHIGFVHSDTVGLTISQLKKRLARDYDLHWTGSFYDFRRLGATMAGQTRNIQEMRVFMGHSGSSLLLDKYMQPLTPEIKPIAAWCERMLESPDINCWQKPVEGPQ